MTNEVNLAGTLRVKPLPSFNAQPGDDYTVMTWATRNGTFTTVDFQGFQPGVTFGVTYTATSLVLELQTAAGIEVAAYDVAGRQVARLFTGRAEAGWHRYPLARDGRLARGVYFGHGRVRARGRDETRVTRLVLAR